MLNYALEISDVVLKINSKIIKYLGAHFDQKLTFISINLLTAVATCKG